MRLLFCWLRLLLSVVACSCVLCVLLVTHMVQHATAAALVHYLPGAGAPAVLCPCLDTNPRGATLALLSETTGPQWLSLLALALLACLLDCLLAYLVHRLLLSTVVERRKVIKLLFNCIDTLHWLAAVIS